MPFANISLPREEIAEFCRTNRIRRLALFGSVLRDDFGPESYFDINLDTVRDILTLDLPRLQREMEHLIPRLS